MLGSKTKRIAYPLTLIVGAVAIAVALFSKPDPETKPLAAAPVPGVEIFSTEPQMMPVSLYSQGVITAAQQIEIVSEVSGRVVDMGEQFAAGGRFASGDVLLAIDSTDYRAALSQAEASLADAKRQLAVERGTARQAKREWRDLNSSEANDLFLRKPQIASAEASLAAARASVEKARLDLERTSVSLPFDGMVIRQDVDLGEFVVSGRAIGEVFALDSAELRLPLSTDQMYKLGDPIGARVIVSSPSSSTQRWEGVIERVESAVDPVSRLHHVVATIDNPFVSIADQTGSFSPPLALGQYVEATIETTLRRPLISLPRDALRQPQNIWVLDSENKLLVLPVDVVERNSLEARIQLGEEGRALLARANMDKTFPLRVVVSDLSLVYSGMQVDVLDRLVPRDDAAGRASKEQATWGGATAQDQAVSSSQL